MNENDAKVSNQLQDDQTYNKETKSNSHKKKERKSKGLYIPENLL